MIPFPPAAEPQPRRLLDQVRDKLRKPHYSPRTDEAYIGWLKRFIWFHNRRHPPSARMQVRLKSHLH